MSDNEDEEITLKKTKGDYAHTAIKATLSSIPIVGGPAAELFDLAIKPPIERRRGAFLECVSKEILKLKDKIISSHKAYLEFTFYLFISSYSSWPYIFGILKSMCQIIESRFERCQYCFRI
jgi:hypothetical protein